MTMEQALADQRTDASDLGCALSWTSIGICEPVPRILTILNVISVVTISPQQVSLDADLSSLPS
jgi:hypothetical protein